MARLRSRFPPSARICGMEGCFHAACRFCFAKFRKTADILLCVSTSASVRVVNANSARDSPGHFFFCGCAAFFASNIRKIQLQKRASVIHSYHRRLFALHDRRLKARSPCAPRTDRAFFACTGTISQLFGSKNPVAGIAKARNNIANIIEMAVHRSAVHMDIRMCCSQRLDAFRRSDDAHEFDALRAAALDDGNRINCGTAGCQHRIEDDHVAFRNIARQFVVILDRL